MPRPIDYPTPRCGGCGAEIESCSGLHGDWMHSSTRLEACSAGGYAAPELPFQIPLRRRFAS